MVVRLPVRPRMAVRLPVRPRRSVRLPVLRWRPMIRPALTRRVQTPTALLLLALLLLALLLLALLLLALLLLAPAAPVPTLCGLTPPARRLALPVPLLSTRTPGLGASGARRQGQHHQRGLRGRLEPRLPAA